MAYARQIDNGLLPYAGGLLDQPAKIVALYNLINSLRIEEEIARAEEANNKAKKALKKR